VSLPSAHSSSTATSSSSSPSSSLAKSAAAKSSPFYYDPTSRYPTPSTSLLLSRDGGILPYLRRKWDRASSLALLEQAVEDHNAEIVATSSNAADMVCYRRCIALPLDDGLFDPPPGVFSHGHVDTGDKMSLSRNFWDAIIRSKAEVSPVCCWSLYHSDACGESAVWWWEFHFVGRRPSRGGTIPLPRAFFRHATVAHRCRIRWIDRFGDLISHARVSLIRFAPPPLFHRRVRERTAHACCTTHRCRGCSRYPASRA
jgi:hypothetical protein